MAAAEAPVAVEAGLLAPVPAAGAAAGQAQPAAGYIGEETCTACHTGYDRSVATTAHGFTANSLTPAARQGCESCHDPGEAHASDPANVKPIQLGRVAADVANAQCQTCHNRGQHALWEGRHTVVATNSVAPSPLAIGRSSAEPYRPAMSVLALRTGATAN